jgi:hypothetical protein
MIRLPDHELVRGAPMNSLIQDYLQPVYHAGGNSRHLAVICAIPGLGYLRDCRVIDLMRIIITN